MSNNTDEPDLARYPFAYHGVVVDRADPEGLHRVRIRIPGIVDPYTQWAFPLTMGGGSPQRGGHSVPAEGAEVVVWFLCGDIERPVYLAGWWTKPAAGISTPTIVKDAGADAHLVTAYEVGNFLLLIDERPGQRKVAASDKTTGLGIVFDLEKQGIIIKGLSSLFLKAVGVLKLEGAQVSVNGRIITSASKAL